MTRRSTNTDRSASRATRRTVVATAAGTVAVLAVAGAQWMVFSGGSEPEHRAATHAATSSHAGTTTELRRVGAPLTARVRGGGEVTLRVRTEAPAGSGASRASVVAGMPVELDVTVPPAAGAPRLAATRLDESLAAMAGSGHGGHGGGASAASGGVAVDRSELFLIDRRDGEVVIPAGQAAADHAGSQPGRAMTERLMPGGALAWATKVTPGATRIEADPRGRFLVATYANRGRVEVLDLLRRERPRAIAVGGSPAGVTFEPGATRAWVADDAAGTLAVVDLLGARVIGRVAVAPGRQALAFGAGGRALVAAADGRARLLDTRSRRVIATEPIARAATSAAFAPAARAFAVAHEDGRVTVLRADRGLRAGRTLATGGAGTRTLGVAGDGRTAVALHERAHALTILDLARERVVRRVQAGTAPVQLAFLGRFALARNAGSADVTWVDLQVPSRSNNVPVGTTPADHLTVRGGTAFASNADDRRIYKLHTMMGRPMVMGEVPNPLGADRAVSSAGGIERIAPRRWLQRTVFERAGRYRVTVRLAGGGRATFKLPVAEEAHDAPKATPVVRDLRARAGESLEVAFRVSGARPGDAQALAYGGRGGILRQLRAPAEPAADGTYRARLNFADPGRYRLVLLSEAAGLRPDDGTWVTVSPPGGTR